MYKCKYISKIGVLTLVGDTENLYELLFEESRYGSKYPDALEDNSLVIFHKVCMWLDAYFSGERYSVDFPIVLEGTSFQVEVWKLLLEIPYGKFVTYKDIANGLNSRAYQAVGNAIGRNPIGIIVPCHRVVKSHGLGGFSGTVAVKKWLLEHENIEV